MKQIIQSFCEFSGQTPNWTKSGIIFSKNVDSCTINAIKNIFPVPHIDNNFIHLGHPLIIPGKNRTAAYNFVLEKFKNKLSTYKADHLSHAARLELIRSVLSSIPVYYMSNILFTKKFIAKIRSIIRNFWWTGIRSETNTKSLCLCAWKNICSPKNEGGLGIRNLQAMNQALILMAAWRLAVNHDNYLYSVLKSKYFPDSSIWRPNVNVPKSAFWVSILKVLPLLKEHSFYQVSTGQISIWSTPWCDGWNKIYDALIIQDNNFNYPNQVKDLWIPQQKKWNNNLIDNLFQEPLASIIKNTPIIDTQEEDLLCWKLTSAGTCNTKSAYRACLEKLYEQGEPRPRQIQQSAKELLQQIWKDKTLVPRVQVFGWRYIRKAIPTGQRAGKYSKHISKLCCRCGSDEDDLHLFFKCPFAKAAWFSEPWFIRTEILIDSSDSLAQSIKKILSLDHPHVNLNNILNFMWCIWKARNDKLFKNKDCNPNQIQFKANAINQNLEILNILQVPVNRSLIKADAQRNQDHVQQVIGVKQGETIKSDLFIAGNKIYSDAAWKTKKAPTDTGRTTTGIGVFCHLCHQEGEMKILIQASIPKSPSPLLAEAIALVFAANLAIQLNISQVTFLTDNLILARAAAADKISDGVVPWELREQIAQYKKASRQINSQIYHIKRDINGIAHNCSQQALRQSLSLPIHSCSNSAHAHNICPLVLAVNNIKLKGLVIHAVQCI